MNNNYGPLFNAQLDAVCSDFEIFGGRIKSLEVGKFETQSGPTCGLVAVRIAALALKCKDVPSVSELLNYSQQKGYTKHGESFSVDWLANIVSQLLPTVDAKVCDFPSVDQLIETISKESGVYLIPYDSDKNFGPFNGIGHSAHWFALTGFFVLDQNEQSLVEFDNKHSNLEDSNFEDSNVEDSHVHLIGFQGKSRNAGLWSYTQMRDSNNQLNEQSPKLQDGSILPEGGITAGLRGRALRILPSK
ncbi:hypothetical protein M3Y97_00070900 [Aphelenchoides bicaudatus]|nr:hypothetical protein M3Y97_00070900 [Aphelenchoides bicaudatus]